MDLVQRTRAVPLNPRRFPEPLSGGEGVNYGMDVGLDL
jgi:hypothetical protein